MFVFFKKKKVVPEPLVVNPIVVAPVSGILLPISAISDPIFSQKMMGDGFGVVPTDSEVNSPVEGEVTSIFPTKHAIGIKTSTGADAIVHMGIETVELNGVPFKIKVKEGQKVAINTPLATVDLAFLKEKEKDTTIIVAFPNQDNLFDLEEREIQAGEQVGTLLN
ncbi:PTS sugar transporter subunit IIA [Trichococcus shcherbakoviae]|uniref:PTS sugar transporter subunit IIA n=1 Tax=Trichococcus shcherbakoviae TaxID=2094020 RepID=UPI002AA6B3E9|nr:PTS glucose transporter subunit IIA [Trichococcus shcherbakoviae]